MDNKIDTSTVKSVLKAFNALDFVLEQSLIRPGAGLSEIAAALKLQPTTVRNILKTMEKNGYIGRAANHMYVPGPKCFGMNRAAVVSAQLTVVMAPLLTDLAESTGESFVLATLFNRERKTVLERMGSAAVVVSSANTERNAGRYDLVTTRVLLAFAPGPEVDYFVELHGLPGKQWDNISNRRTLDEHLAEIRRTGMAESRPGGLYAAAFPVFDRHHFLLASLGYYMPAFRADAELKVKMQTQIISAISSVSDKL